MYSIFVDSLVTRGNLRLLLVVSSNNDGIPERINFRPSVVHDPRQPGEERFWSVVMSVVQGVRLNPGGGEGRRVWNGGKEGGRMDGGRG